MLDLKQIESFYPEYLRTFKRNLLREYLQYKILEAIFDSEFGSQLSFMGGTSIRIVHSNTRFSEDLDFDNLGLDQSRFERLGSFVQKKLELQGYKVETKNVFKGAYRCYMRIPNVLFENHLSAHMGEKLLIELDTEPQQFPYVPERIIINKFDLFLRINVAPVDLLLAQKIYAIFNRKRAMGRDFYDVVFLLGKTKPNWDYLKTKLKIKDAFDFKQLSKDVEPYLFTPSDRKKVLFFQEYLEEYKFA